MNSKCLIKDATPEERKELVQNALAISLLDAGDPTEETKKLAEDYINGVISHEELKRKIIDCYSEGR